MKNKLLKISKIMVVFIVTLSLLFTGSYVNADNEKVILSWSWTDGNETIQYKDEKWQTDQDITDLPQSILAIVENKQETVSVSWNKEENTYQATLEDGYVLEDETNTIIVYITDSIETQESEETETQEDADTSYLDKHVLNNTVSPEGTNINLFDYWVTTNRNDPDGNTPAGSYDNKKEYYNLGINKNHYYKFESQAPSDGSYYNRVFPDTSPEPLIFNRINKDFTTVYRTLENGYPKLSVVGYTQGNQNHEWPEEEENFSYLFDPSSDQEGKKSFSNVKGLLQNDTEGYFYYDSTQNFAEFDEDSNSFKVYDEKGVYARNGTTDLTGQFFPFNKGSEVFNGETNGKLNINQNVNCHSDNMNHYFGLTLTSRFIQKNGGKTNKDKPVEFEFSGDDDVWVFIDDVLVADLGGIHKKSSLNINFETGEIKLSCDDKILYDGQTKNNASSIEKKLPTLKSAFEKAGKYNVDDFEEDTFKDNTYHTLKFFYLERGNYVSNLQLKYNLASVPANSIKKVDESGKGLEGATFSLYEADEKYNVETGALPLCTGTTDESGEYILRDSEDQLISLDQLSQQNKTHFVLKEEKVPTGYRKTGQDIQLELRAAQGEHVKGAYFRTANKAQCGAKARTNATVTVSNNFEYYDGYYGDDGSYNTKAMTIENYDKDKNGLVVAVPIKYVSTEPKTETNLKNIYNYAAVSGNSNDGYTVLNPSTPDPLENMLKVAKEKNTVAQLDTDGSFKMKIEDLPGLVTDYLNWQLATKENAGSDTLYDDSYFSVAYLFIRNATTIDDATLVGEKNTFLIGTNNTFEREYSTSITVFNKQNKVKVQKVDTLGNPIKGTAKFALYKDSDVTDGKVVKENATPVKDNIVTNTTDGTVDVTGLETGIYYLKETQAPAGYEATDQLVEINVTEADVFVNAGTEDDDVDVVMHIGHAVKTYYHFVKGELDLLMRDIKATLKTSTDLKEWTTTDKVGYFSYNMKSALNESQYEFISNGNKISGVESESKINNEDGLCYDSGYGTLEMNLWYTPDKDKKLPASNLGSDEENTSLNNLFNNISVIRVRNKKKETYYLQKDKAADIKDLENVNYTTKNDKITYANNQWTASETGTYETTVTRKKDEGTETVAVTFYVYDVKDNIYVLDYGLKAKLADGTEENNLKDGIFSDDTLSIEGNDTTNKVTSIGKEAETSISGTNGTLNADALNNDAYKTTITYEPTKFMDSEDEFTVTTQVQSGDGEFVNHYNGIKMEENVTVLPASVVYYEDNFAGSGTTEDNSDKPIVYKNATSGGAKVTANVSIDDKWQSIDQLENYGFDEAYNTTDGDANGSTKLDKFCVMQFSFKGTGFDLVGRSSYDSGKIQVGIKKKVGDEWKVLSVYRRDLSYENSEEGKSAALYRLPLYSWQNQEYGEYQITIMVQTSSSEAKGTALYVDGIRIYHPLEDESKYMEEEQGTTTEKLRTLILGGETSLDAENAKVVVVNYAEGDEKPSTLGGTITEDRGFVPSETNDLERYLNVGPKEEVYIRKNSGIAFRVKPTDGKTAKDITLQVEAKLVNTKGISGSGTLTNASVTDDKNIEVKSTSGMYYKVLLGTENDDGSYLVVLANTSDNDISLTNVKYKNCTIEMPKAGDDLTETNVVKPTTDEEQEVLKKYNGDNEDYKVSSANMNQNYMTKDVAGYINVTYKVRKDKAVSKADATGNKINDYEPPVPELYSYDENGLKEIELSDDKNKDNSYWQVGAQEIVEEETTTTTTEKVSYFVYTYRIKVTPTATSDKQLYAVGAKIKDQQIKEPKVLGSKVKETDASVSVVNKETEAVVTLSLTSGMKIVDEEVNEWNKVNDVTYEKNVKENGKYQVHVEDEAAIEGIEDPISQVKVLDYEVQLKTKDNGNDSNKDQDINTSTKNLEVIEGNGSVYKPGNKGLTFKSNIAFKDVIKVLVDGKEVNKKYYTVKDTTIVLHDDYLKTLSNGKHTIEIVSTNGTVKATFTVENNQSSVYTGDENNLVFFGSLLLLSCVGFIVYQRIKARD